VIRIILMEVNSNEIRLVKVGKNFIYYQVINKKKKIDSTY